MILSSLAFSSITVQYMCWKKSIKREDCSNVKYGAYEHWLVCTARTGLDLVCSFLVRKGEPFSVVKADPSVTTLTTQCQQQLSPDKNDDVFFRVKTPLLRPQRQLFSWHQPVVPMLQQEFGSQPWMLPHTLKGLQLEIFWSRFFSWVNTVNTV